MRTATTSIASAAAPRRPKCEGFGDEAAPEETRFQVSHRLHALPAGGTRITYTVRVEGPEAATLGPVVTADYPELLAALKALARPAPAAAA
jgi:hypothetical protein